VGQFPITKTYQELLTDAQGYRLAEVISESSPSRYNWGVLPQSGCILMNPQYPTLFKALDDYIRAEHRCFVAECDLDSFQTEWVICARPTNTNVRALAHDVYACKYFRLTLQEVEEICTSRTLSSVLRSRIDGDLQAITGREAPA
jgi:hypothetical protein